ncbi:hypothetical protein L7F22_056612 [Adiantum nelumboides]|nr:hypothetical protein [Adiantum nelumboides]
MATSRAGSRPLGRRSAPTATPFRASPLRASAMADSIDFLARFTGLPLLNPFQKSSSDFRTGVNNAVDGATALDSAFLNNRRIFVRTQDSALQVQIARHLKLKATSATSSARATLLPNSRAFSDGLYVILIAGNDYLSALRRPKLYPPAVVNKVILPFIISKIRNATEVLYANGARHFLIFGLPPLGCSPSLLAGNAMSVKDRYSCLRDINTLSHNHGVQVLAMVNNLRSLYPKANFIYTDYYGAFNHVIEDSASYGLTNTVDACSGAGALFPYRFKFILFCSRFSTIALTTLCTNPNTYISWDGLHFTDKFNADIFDLTIASGSYLNPSSAFSHCKL